MVRDPDPHRGRLLVGVISDTHGLLRPEALAAFEGADLIIHAGDVGRPNVIPGLEAVAPVVAVRGNVDTGDWAENLPETRLVEIGSAWVYVIHDLSKLNMDPGAAGLSAVVTGHSHRPSLRWERGVLFLNPGSAGPRRFRLPVSVARFRAGTGLADVEIVELERDPAPSHP